VVLRLSRRLSFLLAAILLFGFFAVTAFVSSLQRKRAVREDEVRAPSATAVSELEGRPSGSVVLTNFHRSQTKPTGEKEWEVTAEVGEFLPNTNLIRIRNGILTMFRPDGSTTRLSAPSADLEIIATDLKVATCSGGVTIEYNTEMKITTASLTFWKESGEIVAPSRVTIESTSGTTSGDSLRGNATTRVFQLSGTIQSVFTPAKKEVTP